MAATTLRILVHPDNDRALCAAIAETLISATREYPDTFTLVIGQPNTVDHIGYHDSMLSSVVFAEEYQTAYKRLTIRPGLHPVFAELLTHVLAAHNS